MSLPPEVPQPVDRPNAQPQSDDQRNEIEREMTGFERATLRWARVAVLMSGLAALFVCLQWWEMHQGGVDTHDLAVHAKDQADKMKDMSDAADKIRQAAENMVIQDQRIADNAQRALDASNRQSKAASNATIKQFREDQRAWVGLGNYVIENFDNKEPFRLLLPWFNSGKTPAIDTQVAVSYAITDAYMKGPPKDYRPNFTTANAISPQGIYGSKMTNMAVPSQYDAILNGTKRFYVMGRFRYHDIYSPTIHTTTFCLVYSEISRALIFCEEGNTMD